MSVKYSVIPGSELCPEIVARWTEIQQSNAVYASPYFCPAFTLATSKVRDDVRVGVIEEGNRVIGLFPHQRRWDRTARPVGLRLSDYHGVVAELGARWNAEALLRACGVVRWQFDHLPASQAQFESWFTATSISPVAEVCDGYEVFQARLEKAGRKQIREAERKRERLAEEVGAVRFVPHTQDPMVLQTLMGWKSEQCMRTDGFDFFTLDWCRNLLEELHRVQTEEFGSSLSCLYAGDRLVAAHFALRSQSVWHSWFPAYDVDHGAYSPGSILLLELIKHAASIAVNHIDFGKDMSRYKRRYMTNAIPLAEGCIELPSLINLGNRIRNRIELWSRGSALKPLLRYPGRVLKNFESKRRYD